MRSISPPRKKASFSSEDAVPDGSPRCEAGRQEKKNQMPKTTVSTIKSKKQKITCLTAYDAPTAQILDEAGIDIILVGDSVGNVILGYDNTLPVTMTEMIHHTKAVSRKTKHALLVSDMPLESFKSGEHIAYKDAIKLIKDAGAEAVKIEGTNHLKTIKKIVKAGIPVMGHIGYTPQTVSKPRMFGKNEKEMNCLLNSAKKLEGIGVFAIVLELIAPLAAKKITGSISIPTIGIGSGPFCDGQVLVTHDMVGLYCGKTPKFVKQYADLGTMFKKAVADYISDVKMGRYPK